MNHIQTDDEADDEQISFRSESSSVSDSDSSETLASLKQCREMWVLEDIAAKYHLPQEKPTLEMLDTQGISNNFTPVDYFFLFFDRVLYNMIVEQSNLNLRQEDMRGQVTSDLTSKLIGFLTYSGCVDLRSKDRYWS